jgi:GTPase Era involved in 16S rRNA processing
MSMELPRLRQLGQRFFEHTNVVAAVLCFDHVIHAMNRTTIMSSQHAMAYFPVLLEYVRILALDPSESESIQKLLGIQKLKLPRNSFLIPTETTLYSVLKHSQMFSESLTEEGMRILGRELPRAAKTLFQDRLRHPLSIVTTFKVLKDLPLSTSLQFVR